MSGQSDKDRIPESPSSEFSEIREKKFKEMHGLLETPLTSEEAFAVRVYIEKLQEELNYLAIAGLLKPNVQERLSKFRTIDFERGFKKLLGIGGTNDAEDNE